MNRGKESQALPSLHWRDFFVVNDGIYFISEPGTDRKSFVQFLNFSSGKVKTVALMTGLPYEGSRLRRTVDLLFSQFDELGSDLMLVENFR